MPLLATNNATSLLSSSIDTAALVVSITAGDEAKFPAPAGGTDWFPVVVVDVAANREIMRCTARSGVNLTVVRAQEGTTARAFSAGARVDMRFTAAGINSKADTLSPVLTGSPTVPTPAVGDRSQLIAPTNFSGMVPPGAIIFGVMAATPAGYLVCDGAAVARIGAYAALFAAISTTFGVGNGTTTFNLPDLRGQFIRGADAGRGIDAGRVAGSSQTELIKNHVHPASSVGETQEHTHGVNINSGTGSANHVHSVNGGFTVNAFAIGGGGPPIGRSINSGAAYIWGTDAAGADHYHNVSGNTGGRSSTHTHVITVNNNTGGGAETRPTNVALNGYIKY